MVAVTVVTCVMGAGQAPTTTAGQKVVSSDFEKRAKKYVDLREKIRSRLPQLPEDATPERITSHKLSFQKAVQAARNTAKPGDLFTLPAAALIRSLIKAEFKGWERNELRKTVLEADTKGVPLKINLPYPETKELVEMPPALLLALPQLPKQLRYRFIGRSLGILDSDNALIIDYMKRALP